MRRNLLNRIVNSIVIGLVLIQLGCSEQGVSDEEKQTVIVPQGGGTYHFALRHSPKTLDPVKITDIYSEAVTNQIFEGLVRFGPYLEILPGLAESWSIEDDGRKYRFKIKQGVKFHSGEILTAEDVIFSIKRLLRADPAPLILPHLLKIIGAKGYRTRARENVAGLQQVGQNTVVIHLENSHMPLLAALGMYQAHIVSKKDIHNFKERFDRYPSGTGPFRLSGYDENGAVELVRHDAYHMGVPYLEKIFYRVYENDSYLKVLDDFTKGLLDEIPIYGNAREKLNNGVPYNWFQRPSLSLMFYGMNMQHPNLQSSALREAMSISINRQALVNEVYNGQYEIARTILPLGMPGYNPLKRVGDNDVEVAADMIQRAFADQGKEVPEIELVSAIDGPIVDAEMTLMKEYWARIGVTVNVRYITDWHEFDAYLRSNKVQLYRYAWHADLPDPDSFLYALFSSSSSNNFMQYRDEWVDTILERARGVVNPVQRVKLYQEIESRIMFSTPLIPLMYLNVNRVYQPYVKNINVGALGAHATILDSVWLDKPSLSK